MRCQQLLVRCIVKTSPSGDEGAVRVSDRVNLAAQEALSNWEKGLKNERAGRARMPVFGKKGVHSPGRPDKNFR